MNIMLSIRDIIKICLSGTLFLCAHVALAEDLQEFSVNYDAHYRGLRAQATISLARQEDGAYLAQSLIAIKLLGATVTSINERSLFDWVDEKPWPRRYDFVQSGLGKRSRSVDFNWDENMAMAEVNDNVTELPLSGLILDEMSMYTLIKQAVQNGEEDIYFDVIDKNQIEEAHYHVIGEENVESPLGVFSALKVEKVRENSDRVTQLWFAPEHDMLLVKIYQQDPDGDEYEITIEDAQLNGLSVSAD